jgi:hypothetical protein
MAKTPRVAGRRPPVEAMAYRRPYMSGVTRTLTRSPSVARFSAARFSSGVLAVAGRFSSASRSGLRRSGLPLVCVVATDLMVSTEIVPACPDILDLGLSTFDDLSGPHRSCRVLADLAFVDMCSVWHTRGLGEDEAWHGRGIRTANRPQTARKSQRRANLNRSPRLVSVWRSPANTGENPRKHGGSARVVSPVFAGFRWSRPPQIPRSGTAIPPQIPRSAPGAEQRPLGSGPRWAQERQTSDAYDAEPMLPAALQCGPLGIA